MDVQNSWAALPAGARAALEQQWIGLGASALPCGSSIVDDNGEVVAVGRNHEHDERDGSEVLERSRLAHAELNAIARLDTSVPLAPLTLWTTQHPCAMCSAAIAFVGIGAVTYIADDPSDERTVQERVASEAGVIYDSFDQAVWWGVSNLLFLYPGAVLNGTADGNVRLNRDRYPDLVSLVLEEAAHEALGAAARAGQSLPDALEDLWLVLFGLALRYQHNFEATLTHPSSM